MENEAMQDTGVAYRGGPLAQTDSKRFRAQVPILFSIDGHQGQARGQVYNLSAEGCKVTSDTRVAPGTYLNLRLYLPGSATPVSVRLEP